MHRHLFRSGRAPNPKISNRRFLADKSLFLRHRIPFSALLENSILNTLPNQGSARDRQCHIVRLFVYLLFFRELCRQVFLRRLLGALIPHWARPPVNDFTRPRLANPKRFAKRDGARSRTLLSCRGGSFRPVLCVGPRLPPRADENPVPSAWIRDFPIHPWRQPSLPPVGIRRSGIDELLSRAVSRIKPHFEGHGRVARALLKFENGFIGSFRASVGNGHGRSQDLRFIRIPNLDDVPVGRAIGQPEDVRPRRQHLPGDFHRIAEGNDGFSVPLIRSSARGEYGPKQHSDQPSTYCKYSYSQSLHATTLLGGLAGPNGQGWRLRMKLGRPKPATRTELHNRAVLPGLLCLLPRPWDAPPPPEVAHKVASPR